MYIYYIININSKYLQIMKTFNVTKQRDGQSAKVVNEIYAEDFAEAKIVFAKLMTYHNHEKSNNVQWLTHETDNVLDDGWYDLRGGRFEVDEDGKAIYPAEAKDFLMVTEDSINAGFSYWNEDVYTWELLDGNNEF